MTPSPITDDELNALEHDVLAALAVADPSRLTLLGEGEISLVLAGGEDRAWACKRLPPFGSADAAGRYAATIERYVVEYVVELLHVADADDSWLNSLSSKPFG